MSTSTAMLDVTCARLPLLFVRHGATQPNLNGLRCGGDLDLPMTDLGRQQIALAAHQVRAQGHPVDVIFASDLQRTHEAALIASEILGGVPVVIEPALKERFLGEWNLRPIDETEVALREGRTPPQGESDASFTRRIENALRNLLAGAYELPLLIGSKGVARVLRQRLAPHSTGPARNGESMLLDASPLRHVRALRAAS